MYMSSDNIFYVDDLARKYTKVYHITYTVHNLVEPITNSENMMKTMKYRFPLQHVKKYTSSMTANKHKRFTYMDNSTDLDHSSLTLSSLKCIARKS